MSRSKGDRGRQPPKDLWSSRPNAGATNCKEARKECARIERNQDKDLIRKEVDQDAYWGFCWHCGAEFHGDSNIRTHKC